MNGDHPNYNSVENGQNTEMSLGDLRRLAVTQTPMKNHQLTLVWNTRQEDNNNVGVPTWSIDLSLSRHRSQLYVLLRAPSVRSELMTLSAYNVVKSDA